MDVGRAGGPDTPAVALVVVAWRAPAVGREGEAGDAGVGAGAQAAAPV